MKLGRGAKASMTLGEVPLDADLASAQRCQLLEGSGGEVEASRGAARALVDELGSDTPGSVADPGRLAALVPPVPGVGGDGEDVVVAAAVPTTSSLTGVEL